MSFLYNIVMDLLWTFMFKKYFKLKNDLLLISISKIIKTYNYI